MQCVLLEFGILFNSILSAWLLAFPSEVTLSFCSLLLSFIVWFASCHIELNMLAFLYCRNI